jgi:hypothetical protein
MCSEILYLFFYESSASMFEHPENLLLTANKKIFAIPVSAFVKVLKVVE